MLPRIERISSATGFVFPRDRTREGVTRVLAHQIEGVDQKWEVLSPIVEHTIRTPNMRHHTINVVVLDNGSGVVRIMPTDRDAVKGAIESGLEEFNRSRGAQISLCRGSSVVWFAEPDSETTARVHEIFRYVDS